MKRPSCGRQPQLQVSTGGIAFGLLWMLLANPLGFAASPPEVLAVEHHLGAPLAGQQSAQRLTSASEINASIVDDTYSAAPLVQTQSLAFYVSDENGPTQHTFDGLIETGGNNLLGSPGGFFAVLEQTVLLGAGVERVIVEFAAVSAQIEFEPWVNIAHAGDGYRSWRLDVGSTSGGINPIQPEPPFTLVGSGFRVFDSNGQLLDSFPMSANTSTATSLSGVALLGNSGNDIAGVDVSAIQMYWDIMPQPTDLALTLVEAEDGAHLPGSPLDVFVEIENLGPVTSGTSILRLYASANAIISGGDQLLDEFSLGSIPSGELLAAFAGTTIPADLAEGVYYIGGILSATDTSAANNTAHDPLPITVSTDPRIRIRPLSLDFTEAADGLTVESSEVAASLARKEMTRLAMPHLLQTARNQGQVRIIVGLDVPFKPEGLLVADGKLSQRQEIQTRASQLMADLRGFTVQENRRFRFIPFVALTVDADALERLAKSPLVASIEEDTLSFPSLSSSNAVVGAPLAWAEGYDGDGQSIAVLDTGVDKAHPWFSTGGSKVVAEACYSHTDVDATSLCPGGAASSTAAGSGVHCDDSITGCDHGTHVAGIAAGNDATGPEYGVARGADIIAMQVFSRFDSQAFCGDDPAPCLSSFTSDQISALERVFELKDTHDIAAVNMSLGGGQFFNQATCDAAHPSLKAAIDNLRSFQIATVIAAGNDGWKDSISAPACISSAVSVSNSTDADTVSFDANVYPQIHLLAPGTAITSSVPGAGTADFSGTSMSAPHVAGAWAVLKQLDPAGTVDDVLSLLQATGTPVDDARAGGVETGMPRMNLDLAIGEPRTTFGIFNDGPGALTVSSITRETPAPWITWTPQAPFNVPAGQLKVVTINIDFASAPDGTSQTRLLVNSNDPDKLIFPGGIYINVSTLETPGDEVFADGFED